MCLGAVIVGSVDGNRMWGSKSVLWWEILFFSMTEVYVFRGCDCGVRGW